MQTYVTLWKYTKDGLLDMQKTPDRPFRPVPLLAMGGQLCVHPLTTIEENQLRFVNFTAGTERDKNSQSGLHVLHTVL